MIHAEKILSTMPLRVEYRNKSTVYIYGLPCCSECFKGLIQVGVKRVVMPNIENHGNRWKDGCNLQK